MAKLFSRPTYQALDANGDAISGARLFFYLTGTSTKHDTYTDDALSVAHANPVVADSAGRFAPIYLQDDDYKVFLAIAGADDPPTTPIQTIDPVHGADYSPFYINAKDEGVKVDGVTDDRAALQALFDKIVSGGVRRTVFVPAGTLRCDTGVTVNMSFISLRMDKTQWDFSNMTTGVAVTVTGTENLPRAQWIGTFEGFNMVGPGKVSTVDGFDLNSDTAVIGPNRLAFRDVRVNAFRTGVLLRNRSYLNSFWHCDITGCGTGISLPAGITGGGENYTYWGGLLSENTIDLEVDDESDWNFFGTSFDASDQILDASGASGHVMMSFHGCHIEKVGGVWASAPYKMDEAVSLRFYGGVIEQGSLTATLDYLFDHSNSTNRVGGAILYGTRLQNMFTANDRLYNGQGRFAWYDMGLIGATTTIERPWSTQQSVLIDGGFESTETIDIKDDWSVRDDGVNIPTAFDTSPRVNLSNQAVEFNSGLRSLEMAVTTSVCSVGLYVPFEIDQFGMVEFYYKWDVAPTTIDVSLRWVKGYIDPATRIWQEIDITGAKHSFGNLNATTWTKVTGPGHTAIHANMNPGGYNRLVLFFSFQAGAAGKSMFIDDVVVNISG